MEINKHKYSNLFIILYIVRWKGIYILIIQKQKKKKIKSTTNYRKQWKKIKRFNKFIMFKI